MQNRQDLEKQIFEENYKKQSSKARKVFVLVFGIMGGVFLLLGAIFLLAVEAELLGLVYMALGAFFLLMGGVFLLIFPKKPNYDRYKRLLDNYGNGGLNIYELIARITVLENRVDELEKALERMRSSEISGDQNRE